MSYKVLVTGGAGFIGSHLVDELVSLGHDVRMLDSLDPQVHGQNQQPPSHLNSSAQFIKGDVRDPDTVKKALEDVEVIFHEAAAVGVGQSMYQVRHYIDVNCTGTAQLLDEVVNGEHDIKKMVVASSMSIYGEGKYSCLNCGIVEARFRPESQLKAHDWEMKCPECGSTAKALKTDEEKILRPTSVYATSKRDQEELFLEVGQAYGIPSVALRYFNVYGPRQSLNNPYTGVCAIFQSNIKNSNPPIIYEDGLQSRDFIHVKDIANANLLVLEKEAANYGYYNVGCSKPITVLDIANTLCELYGEDLTPRIQNKFRAGDIRHCVSDSSKIQKLGFEPEYDFKTGMADLVEWGRSQDANDMSEKALNELKSHNLIEQ